MEHFFILGRNPVLSKAELFSYLESKELEFEEIIYDKNYLIIDIPEHKFDIQDFGGMLKLGKIMFRGDKKDFKEFLNKNDLIDKEKFTFSILGNSSESEELLKDKFKEERRKAMIRHGNKSLKLQEGDEMEITNSEYKFFVFEDEWELYFGMVEQVYSHLKIKQRDMKKPVRRQSLAISPRLAKILINLSQVKKNQLLVDGFCGVGGILIEGVIKGVNVYGVDKNPKAIEQCKQNMRWLEKNYKLEGSWKVLESDIRMVSNLKFDAFVSEPALGEVFRKKLKDSEAKNLVQNFERSIIQVLKKLKAMKKEGSKIVLTMPFVREFEVDLRKIVRETGLHIYDLKGIRFPIKEFRPKQFISRDVVVFA